nr:glycosyltransferase [Parabacteroides sp. An277]
MHIGGVQTFIVNYAPYLMRNGIRLNIAVQVDHEEIYDKYLESIGCRIFHITSLNKSKIRFMKDIYHLLNQHPEIKIIHSHQNFSNVYALLAAKIQGTKIRISHSHSNIKASSLSRKVMRKLLQWILPYYATDYWGCSMEAAQWLFGKYANSNRCFVINNAINLNLYAYNEDTRNILRKEMNLEGKIVWVQVGSLSSNKNQTFSIHLFQKFHAKYPDSFFLLCGDGQIKGQLTKIIEEKGLTNCVRLLGNVTNVNEILNACDLFIMPSLFEGLGLSAIEAQASGLPCVVSSAIPDDALINNNIIKCHTWNEDEWLKAIENVYSLHTNREDAFITIQQAGYDVKIEADKLASKYKQLVNRI